MPPPSDWSLFRKGSNAEVWMHIRCKSELIGDLEGRDRSKIEATMEEYYCELESLSDMPPDRFNPNEGRERVGNKDCLFRAFKARRGGRVYGVEGSVNGSRAFFCACAMVKKTGKLDPADRTRAANRLSNVTSVVPGAAL